MRGSLLGRRVLKVFRGSFHLVEEVRASEVSPPQCWAWHLILALFQASLGEEVPRVQGRGFQGRGNQLTTLRRSCGPQGLFSARTQGPGPEGVCGTGRSRASLSKTSPRVFCHRIRPPTHQLGTLVCSG